ncbi:unnamed protein product [Camellia sinensis]
MAAFSALSLCPYNFSCRPNPNKRCFLCSLASPSSIGVRVDLKYPVKNQEDWKGLEKVWKILFSVRWNSFMKGLMVHLSVSLPIGGLGEIGMNCMLVGNYDRYILIDAGVMFPDYDELGVQKIIRDTTFIRKWSHKIEAVVVTQSHEDHIGALPW